jgi:hypothetical protein
VMPQRPDLVSKFNQLPGSPLASPQELCRAIGCLGGDILGYADTGSSRGADRSTPPSQIRTCSFPASGSSVGYLDHAICWRQPCTIQVRWGR